MANGGVYAVTVDPWAELNGVCVVVGSGGSISVIMMQNISCPFLVFSKNLLGPGL